MKPKKIRKRKRVKVPFLLIITVLIGVFGCRTVYSSKTQSDALKKGEKEARRYQKEFDNSFLYSISYGKTCEVWSFHNGSIFYSHVELGHKIKRRTIPCPFDFSLIKEHFLNNRSTLESTFNLDDSYIVFKFQDSIKISFSREKLNVLADNPETTAFFKFLRQENILY